MSSALLLVGAAFSLVVGAISPPDELCPRLKQFEREARRQAQAEVVEVFWDHSESGLPSLACKYRNNSIGKRLCTWLPKHVSWEFDGMLPRRISACYGLPVERFGIDKFPDTPTTIPLSSGGRLLMETGRFGPASLPRLRLTFPGRAN